MGGDLDDLVAYLACRGPAGTSRDDGAAAASGAASERGDIGVTLTQDDIVDVHAELVGHHLDHGGLQALAVRAGAHHDHDLARRLDPHRRRLDPDGADPAGGRFDVEPDADTEQPSFESGGGLLGPKAGVVDDLGRLFEDSDGVTWSKTIPPAEV